MMSKGGYCKGALYHYGDDLGSRILRLFVSA